MGALKDKSDSHETWHSDSASKEEQFDQKNFRICQHFLMTSFYRRGLLITELAYILPTVGSICLKLCT